jgi:hypothetical protein
MTCSSNQYSTGNVLRRGRYVKPVVQNLSKSYARTDPLGSGE